MIPEEPDGSGHLRKAVLNQLFSGQGLVLRREKAVDRVAEITGVHPALNFGIFAIRE